MTTFDLILSPIVDITGGGAVASVNGHTGTVVLTSSDVGAQPLDSDLTAIAALTTTSFGRNILALADAAALRTAAALGDVATHPASDFDAAGTAAAAVAALVNSAPGTLDTLNELATALGDDPNFATTITTALAGKQPLDSDLTAVAALTTTVFGRGLLTLADAAAAKTLLAIAAGDVSGLATVATSGSATDLSAGTLPAARFPALTGDVTTSSGALGTTLATVNSNVGTFGDSTHVGQVTVNAKGLVTAASAVTITGAAPTGSAGGDLTGTYPNPTLAASGPGTSTVGDATHVPVLTPDTKGRVNTLTSTAIALTATGDATGTLPGALTLKNTGPGAMGPLGTASRTPAVTIDAQGRVTALSDQAIAIAAGAVSGLGTLATKSTVASADITDGTIVDADINAAAAIASSKIAGLAAVATSGSAADLSAGTLPAARFPALTGDVTNSAGALATTLKNTGPGAGTTGDASHSLAVTIDAQGRVTALTANAVAITESQVTNLTTDLTARELTANKGAANGYAALDADSEATEDYSAHMFEALTFR